MARKVRTHYDNLKVARDAPPEVIRAAYKSLSQKYHPDRNSGDPNASRTMAIINAAYRVLSDPNLRKAHDEWIRKAEAESAPKPRMTTPSQANRPAPPKPPRPQASVYNSKYRVVNHLRHYWWLYLFIALIECVLLLTILVLQST